MIFQKLNIVKTMLNVSHIPKTPAKRKKNNWTLLQKESILLTNHLIHISKKPKNLFNSKADYSHISTCQTL